MVSSQTERHRLGGLFRGGVLTFARFSEAFLILKAENAGLSLAFVLLVLNIIYAASAYPMGALATGSIPDSFLSPASSSHRRGHRTRDSPGSLTGSDTNIRIRPGTETRVLRRSTRISNRSGRLCARLLARLAVFLSSIMLPAAASRYDMLRSNTSRKGHAYVPP